MSNTIIHFHLVMSSSSGLDSLSTFQEPSLGKPSRNSSHSHLKTYPTIWYKLYRTAAIRFLRLKCQSTKVSLVTACQTDLPSEAPCQFIQSLLGTWNLNMSGRSYDRTTASRRHKNNAKQLMPQSRKRIGNLNSMRLFNKSLR